MQIKRFEVPEPVVSHRGVRVHNDHDNRASHDTPTAPKIAKALHKLRSASSLISVAINEELLGSNDERMLERLYCIKGGLTCAIEETEKHISTGEH